MAYAARSLRTLAYADGFTLWMYGTADGRAEVLGEPGYFAAAADLLRRGDMILTNYAGGATILSVASTVGGVTVADITNPAGPGFGLMQGDI